MKNIDWIRQASPEHFAEWLRCIAFEECDFCSYCGNPEKCKWRDSDACLQGITEQLNEENEYDYLD